MLAVRFDKQNGFMRKHGIPAGVYQYFMTLKDDGTKKIRSGSVYLVNLEQQKVLGPFNGLADKNLVNITNGTKSENNYYLYNAVTGERKGIDLPVNPLRLNINQFPTISSGKKNIFNLQDLSFGRQKLSKRNPSNLVRRDIMYLRKL